MFAVSKLQSVKQFNQCFAHLSLTDWEDVISRNYCVDEDDYLRELMILAKPTLNEAKEIH